MTYIIKPLSEELLFITWDTPPSGKKGVQFVNHLNRYFNNTSHKLCLFVDTQNGLFFDLSLQPKIIKLAAHPQLCRAAIYGTHILLSPFVKLFMSLNRRNNVEFFNTSDEALQYLSKCRPGIVERANMSYFATRIDLGF